MAYIVSHLGAANHARIGREEMRCFVEEKKLTERVHITKDGELLSFEEFLERKHRTNNDYAQAAAHSKAFNIGIPHGVCI